MIRTSRRRLLAGATLAALAGCIGDPSDDPTADDTVTPMDPPDIDGTDDSLPEEMVEALDPVPSAVDGEDISLLRTTATTEGRQQYGALPTLGSPSDFGLDASVVDRMVAARYGGERTLVVVLGSFGADKPTFPRDEAEPSVHREDGLFVAAVRSEGASWPAGAEAAADAMDGETPLSADATLALSQVSEYEAVAVYPSYSGDASSAPVADVDGAEVAAFGGRRVDPTTVQISLTAVFEDESAVDADAFEASFTESVSAGTSDVSVEQDGRVAVATMRADQPSEAVRERTPSVGIEARYDGEDGTVTLEHRGGDSVDTDRLTLLVEDDPVESPWSDGSFEAGDSVTVAADPFAFVAIEWSDPEAELTRTIAAELAAPRDVFESGYDPATGTVTFTYTGDRPVESTDRLEISQRSATAERRPPDETDAEPLSKRYGTLAPDTDILVEGVEYGDRVSLRVSYEFDNSSGSMSLAIVHPEPPGAFHVESDPDRRLVYRGETARPAANYRLTVGGDDPGTALSDAYDTLETGDSVPVGGEAGERVTVEWIGEGGPATVFDRRLRPSVSFEIRPDGDGGISLVYRGDRAFDAEAFTVTIDGKEGETLFAAAHDQLSDGDAVAVDGVFRRILVEWTEPEEPMHVGTVFLRRALSFEIDGSDLVFTGEGEWPAASLSVTFGGAAVDGFSGTVSNGDTVSLDADRGDTVEVEFAVDGESETVFEGTVHPPLAFDLSYDAAAGEATLTSATDAELDPERLRVISPSREYAGETSRWAETHDTVEAGDSVTLDVGEDTELIVVVHEAWDAHVELPVED